MKDNDLEHYREVIGGDNITFEPVLFDRAYKQLRTGKFQQILLLVQKLMSGSNKDYENSTDKAFFYWYPQEDDKQNLDEKMKYQYRILADYIKHRHNKLSSKNI